MLLLWQQAYFSIADEDTMQEKRGKKKKKKKVKEVSMFLLNPQSTALPQGGSSEPIKK